VKVLRVAIPDGAQVSLETIQAGRRVLKGLRLGPVEATDAGASDAEAGPIAEPAAGETIADAVTGTEESSRSLQDASTPAIRLGQVGWFRSQRFVEILYTPAIPGPPDATGARDVEFFPSVDASIVVDGVLWDAVRENAATAAHDPHFEESYRKAFVNYEEGKAYRSWVPTRRGARTDLATPFASGTALLSAGDSAATAPLPPASSVFSGATTPVYRVVVKETGIHRLTHSYLTGVAPGLVGANPNNFKVLNMGVEVPIRLVTALNGVFAGGDYIEFYGEGRTSEPELVVNVDNPEPFVDILQANDYTDENVYFLFAEPGPRARVPDLPGPFNGALPLASSFQETIHREVDNRFVPDGANDPFYQFPFLFDNNMPVVPDPNAANCGYANPGAHTFVNHLGPGYISSDARYCPACDLSLPDAISTANPATVRVRLRGTSNPTNVNPDHLAIVQVGTLAAQSTALCWDGELVKTLSVAVPQTSLLGTGDVVYVAQPGLAATATRESLIIDWIEADYERDLKLNGAELVAGFSNAGRTYEVTGFASGADSNIVVYDISRTVLGSVVPSPRRVTAGVVGGGGGNFSYTFSLGADAGLSPGAPRRFAAAGAGGFRTPVRVETVTGEDLTLTTHQADMIVITTPANVDQSPGSAFSDYLAHRAMDSGLTIKVVMMRDVYDHFSYGVETPQAMRDFLDYAFDHWTGPGGTSPPVSYVMLIGDGTADYKNLNTTTQADWVNQVPTFMMYTPGLVLDYYASDTYIASFRGADQLPDVHMGRIATRTAAESEIVFSKMLAYDLSPTPGAWQAHALFLGDKGKTAGETFEIEAIQTNTATTYFPGGAFTSELLFYDDPNHGSGTNELDFRADYVALADAGAALTSYLGHGSFAVWGDDNLFFSSSMPLLSPTQKPGFLINENCLAGGFHALGQESIAEAFLKAEDKGAIAVIAPAGLSFSFTAVDINESIYGGLFGPHKVRQFGQLMTDVRLSLPISDSQAYVFLGDPAQRFILPAPRAPENFSAVTGQDGHVDLNWSPGPDAGTLTRIFRATERPDLPYEVVAQGVAGTSYNDTDVINGIPYFYRALSVDPNGVYEGAITNLNTDCMLLDLPTSGSDCVWARPLNPNPPATPTGFVVSNPGEGVMLDVGWNAPPIDDLDFHTIHYGTTPDGPYPLTTQFDAPLAAGSLLGLTSGQDYYMVLTATNLSGLTSSPTSEIASTPATFEGVNPPQFIDDLQLLRSQTQPSSIELRWTPPAEDIYGGVMTPLKFEVYRSTVPLFTPNETNLVATIPDTDANGWIDPGAYASPQSYYYLVTVTDLNGQSSGAGRQLPDGIGDLTMSIQSIQGTLGLSWSPVTTSVTGGGTVVDHYVVYSGTMPLSRASLDAMTPFAPSVTSTSFSMPVPPDGIMYFSVIAVDRFGNRSPF